jgi:hypothetical protein
VGPDGQVLGACTSAVMGHILHRRTRVGAAHVAPHGEICLGVRVRGTASPDSGVSLSLRRLNKVSLQPIGSRQLMRSRDGQLVVKRAVQKKLIRRSYVVVDGDTYQCEYLGRSGPQATIGPLMRPSTIDSGELLGLKSIPSVATSRYHHMSTSLVSAFARLLESSRVPVMRAVLALGAMIVLQVPGAAMATLGGSAQSIAADQQALGGQLRVPNQAQLSTGAQELQEQTPASSATSNAAYTVEQISSPSGVTVNEYLSANGTVFAVSWRGPTPPDLSQLFGSYFAEYQTAAAQPHAQRGPLLVQTENLVVETSGHMRDLRGIAYLPALLPPGVSADEIQ